MDAAAVGDFLGGIAAVAGDLNGVHLEKYGQGSHNGAAKNTSSLYKKEKLPFLFLRLRLFRPLI